MPIRFCALPVVLGLACSLAHAQTTPAPLTATQPNMESLADTLAKIRQLNRPGINRQIVDVATQALDKNRTDKPNPRLLYWRGLARRRIYLLDEARKDLQTLGDYKPNPASMPASQILAKVNELLAGRPPLRTVVSSQDGKTVLFRVYSPDDDAYLRTVIANLPQAYKAASAFTGLQTDEIPVYVFNTARYFDYVEFSRTVMGQRQQLNWVGTVTRSGTITVSQRNGLNSAGRPSNDPRMIRTLSHETTHQLIRGLVGSTTGMPNWFSEGIAQFCEGLEYPQVYAQNDKTIRTLVAQDAILPLSPLEGGKEFHAGVTALRNGEQKGNPYAQGLSMTRYLVSLFKERKIPDFLQSIRQKESFDAALQEATGFSKEEFYDSWKKTLSSAVPQNPVA